jgi:3-oxoacyl-[acyl-carrier protein] reductase
MKRYALVTGGSRGIGRAIAIELAKDGCAILLNYKSNHAEAEATKQMIEAAGGEAELMPFDVSQPDAINAALDQWFAAHPDEYIDVLVNNAGIAQIAMMQDVSDSDWRRMIDTNLSAAFYVSREVVPCMIRRGHGAVVHIGSMWGKTGASCEVAYSAAKAGIRGLTQSMAKELGPSGIRVNCVEPGVIDTEMNATLDEGTRSLLMDETPLCRLGLPAEIASAVVFLAGEDASFITGQILGVDGGFAV